MARNKVSAMICQHSNVFLYTSLFESLLWRGYGRRGPFAFCTHNSTSYLYSNHFYGGVVGTAVPSVTEAACVVHGAHTQIPYVVLPSSISLCRDATKFNGARVDTNGLIVPLDARWHRYLKCCFWEEGKEERILSKRWERFTIRNESLTAYSFGAEANRSILS